MAWTWLKSFFVNVDEVNEDLEELTENKIILPAPLDLRIGRVSSLQDKTIEINSKFVCHNADLPFKLEVGTLVRYALPTNPDSNVVTFIEVDDRDDSIGKNEFVSECEGVVEFIDSNRIVIGPMNLCLIKENVDLTYEPQTGDYISIIKDNIVRISPRECKINVSTLKSWNGKVGFLHDGTLIQSECFDHYLMPKVGDKIICNTIPCKGEGFERRCLVATKMSRNHRREQIEVDNIPPFIVKEGQVVEIEVGIKNKSFKILEIECVQIDPITNAVTIDANLVSSIQPGCRIKYMLKCFGKVSGQNKFNLIFKFTKFRYVRTVKYLTVTDDLYKTTVQKHNRQRGSFVFNSYNFTNSNKFLPIKGPEYEIPPYLVTKIYESEGDILDYMNSIQKQWPEMELGVSPNTYDTFFHILLHLEEIAQNQMLEQLETVVPLIRRGEYYVFPFDEDSRFTCLCPGDLAYLSNPLANDTGSCAVRIFRTNLNEIIFKFQDVYNVIGDKCPIFRMKFKISRTCIRRKHLAIDLFNKNTGTKWLFPDNIQPSVREKLGFVDNGKFDQNIQNLNIEQIKAVDDIVHKQDNIDFPYLVFGPPGTGKTITLVAATIQILNTLPNCHILVAAPSNSAVNAYCQLLLENTLLSPKDLLRLVSFKYSQSNQLPIQLENYAATLNEEDLGTGNKIRACNAENIFGYKIVAGTINALNVINCTGYPHGHFTHIMIDEAGQATEPETLIPLAGMKRGQTRVVLAGDPNQLGPVINSQIAKEYGLGESLMGRLLALPVYSRFVRGDRCGSANPQIATMLKKNYRSFPQLVNLTSSLFYNDLLEATIAEDTPNDVTELVKKTSFGNCSSRLLFLNTNSKESTMSGESRSIMNLNEAGKVVFVTLELYRNGVNPHNIGVITPYKLQVQTIRNCFLSLKIGVPKIGTVEEFQGSERDIIILSLVRTTEKECTLSFIENNKRANVALSRAKVLNVIIGHENTLLKSCLWKMVLNKAFKTKS